MRLELSGWHGWALALLLVLGVGCAPATDLAIHGPEPTAAPVTERVVKVGVLLGLTGAQASSGQALRAALELGLEDANRYLAAEGRALRVSLSFEDDGSDPATALLKLQALEAQGIRLVIGPDSSESLAYLRGYAQAHGLVLMSPSSTAPSLALEDLVVRTAPADHLQARAIAWLMDALALRELVTVYRDDPWGRELNEQLGLAAGTFQIGLAASHSYPVQAPASAVASLSAAVAQAIARVGTASVAVGLLSFDEGREIMRAAEGDPVLGRVRWLGCDGNALSPAIGADASASAFATRTGFLAAAFASPLETARAGATTSAFVPAFAHVREALTARLGSSLGAYAYIAYDTAWLAALTVDQLQGQLAAPQLVDALWQQARTLRGASGPMSFNPMMDRSRGDFAFHGLVGTTWVRRAVYHDLDLATWPASSSLPALVLEGVTP